MLKCIWRVFLYFDIIIIIIIIIIIWSSWALFSKLS
jgi:uncharacterized membrane protein YukC